MCWVIKMTTSLFGPFCTIACDHPHLIPSRPRRLAACCTRSCTLPELTACCQQHSSYFISYNCCSLVLTISMSYLFLWSSPLLMALLHALHGRSLLGVTAAVLVLRSRSSTLLLITSPTTQKGRSNQSVTRPSTPSSAHNP